MKHSPEITEAFDILLIKAAEKHIAVAYGKYLREEISRDAYLSEVDKATTIPENWMK
jgi:hypothetical protein